MGLTIAGAFAIGGLQSTACNTAPADLASRLNELETTYSAVIDQDSREIEACQSLICEQAAKLEVAAGLRGYDDGLSRICWPNRYADAVAALSRSNAAMATAYMNWSEAATPADDQVLGNLAQAAQERRDASHATIVSLIKP